MESLPQKLHVLLPDRGEDKGCVDPSASKPQPGIF